MDWNAKEKERVKTVRGSMAWSAARIDIFSCFAFLLGMVMVIMDGSAGLQMHEMRRGKLGVLAYILLCLSWRLAIWMVTMHDVARSVSLLLPVLFLDLLNILFEESCTVRSDTND